MPHILSTPVLPVLDPLEFARGALCATSYLSTHESRETHVAKLQVMFERAGLAETMVESLRTMQLLREAEPLGGGYWIPAPLRVVDLSSNCCLLVGPQPTSELQRHFASVRRAGTGRVIDVAETLELPKQSQAAWRGSDGSDASAWAQAAVDSALKQLAPSLVVDGLEIFGTRINGKRFEPAWVPLGSDAACEWRGIGLFRSRTSATRYRSFFGKYETGKEFLEGPAIRDLARLQFGFAALLRRPMTITIAAVSGATSISLPLAPPRNVWRLLVALCHVDPRSFGRIWTCCEPAHLPMLLAAIQELTCKTAHHE
jgi:hypothetical protein